MLSYAYKSDWQVLYLIDLSYIFNHFIENLPSIGSLEFCKSIDSNPSYKAGPNLFSTTADSQSNVTEFYNELGGNEIKDMLFNLKSKISDCKAEDFYSFLVVYKSIKSKDKKTHSGEDLPSADGISSANNVTKGDAEIYNIFSTRLSGFSFDMIDEYYYSFLLYPLEAYDFLVARDPCFFDSVISQIISYLESKVTLLYNFEIAKKINKWFFFFFKYEKLIQTLKILILF